MLSDGNCTAEIALLLTAVIKFPHIREVPNNLLLASQTVMRFVDWNFGTAIPNGQLNKLIFSLETTCL